jgi:hypothetical protein
MPSPSIAVMESIKDGDDMDPPPEPRPNATPAEIRNFDRTERYYSKYLEARLSVSCSKEIQSRVNQNVEASAYKRNEEVGKLWTFIKEIVKGAGFSDAMSHLTDMFSYRISSPENFGTD